MLNNSSNGYICIVDYNLSRVADVKMMATYARENYRLGTILVRANPTAIDFELADVVINLDPLQKDFCEQALLSLEPYQPEIRAVLPFSDNSVASGARLAEIMNLRADSSTLAARAFSKQVYREAERLEPRPNNVMIPDSMTIHSLAQLNQFMTKHGSIILKPSCEGNNRGVIRLEKGDSLIDAMNEVSQYLSDGLIAEQVIDLDDEYSFDGIGHLEFITQKVSVLGRYPVECGQVIPAILSPASQQTISEAGRFANQIVGQKLGPFHNEIKHDAKSQMAGVIEPNRRPAGMRIWHLAERAFGVNMFELWLDQMILGRLPQALPKAKRRVGIRMLPAPVNGILKFHTDSASKSAGFILNVIGEFNKSRSADSKPIRFFEFQWNSRKNQEVSSVQSDNSKFIAQICMEIDDPNFDLETEMNRFADVWNKCLVPWIHNPAAANQPHESEIAG